jgi:hypothetical protein
MSSDSLGDWSDKERIIDRFFGVGAKIGDAMAAFLQKVPNLFFVKKSGVV